MTFKRHTIVLSLFAWLIPCFVLAQYTGGTGKGADWDQFGGLMNGAEQVATQLVFTPEPSSVSSNQSFTTMAELRDAAGNRAAFSPLANGAVNLAFASNPSAGTLSGTTTVNAVDGLVTFSGLSINNTGIGYTLQASIGALSVTSSPFDVFHIYFGGGGRGDARSVFGGLMNGAEQIATQIVFTSVPSSVSSNQSFTTVAELRDAAGNRAAFSPMSNGAVNLALASNPSASTLSGTTTVNAVEGLVTFSGLSINNTGIGYTLQASIGALSVISSPFDVFHIYFGGGGRGDARSVFGGLMNGAAQVATQLVFNPQPVSVSADQSFTTVAEFRDAVGNIAAFSSLSNGPVNLAIATNPSAGTLSGTTTVNAVDGVVTFSEMSINNIGAGYTLQASGGALSAISAPFDVFNIYTGGSGKGDTWNMFGGLMNGAAQVATQLIFNPQPVSVSAGQRFTAVAEFRDAFGNIAAFSSLSNGPVNLAIASNPAAGTLSGSNTVNAQDGVATFSGLSINNTGLGYTLEASTGTLTGISSPFDVFNIYTGGIGKGDARDIKDISTLGDHVFWRGGAPGSPTAWNTPANWWPDAAVPDAARPIWIEPNTNGHNLVLDQNRTIASINFNGSRKKVVLGAHTLTVTGNILDADPNNYFITGSTGSLLRPVLHGASVLFPVGGSSIYNPVTITNNTGTVDDFSVRVSNGVLINGNSGASVSAPRVDLTWHINKNNPTATAGNGVDFLFQWLPAQEAGGINTFFLNHYNGSNWVFANSYGGQESFIPGNPKALSFTGYKGIFSPFAISNSASLLYASLLTFSGRQEQQKVLLQWITTTEQNTHYFEVERSTNGISFAPIGIIGAAGNSVTERNYQFNDERPLNGVVFYRLRIVNLDGKFSYSQVISIRIAVLSKIWVGPSPTAGPLILRMPSDWKGVYEWSLHDTKGIMVMRGNGLRTGTHTINLHHLTAGIYQLSFWENGRLLQQQWVLCQ